MGLWLKHLLLLALALLALSRLSVAQPTQHGEVDSACLSRIAIAAQG